MATKSNNNVADGVALVWRPDFRDIQRLPDVKPVRTGFVLSLVTVVLVIALYAFIGYREYASAYLRGDVATLDAEIARNADENRKRVRESGEFSKLSGKVSELQAFLKMPMQPSDLLLTIAEFRPPQVLLTNLVYGVRVISAGREKTAFYEASFNAIARGSPFEVSNTVNSFKQSLEAAPVFQNNLKRLDLVTLQRDPVRDLFTLAIAIELNVPGEAQE